jgi:hypothetical protein
MSGLCSFFCLLFIFLGLTSLGCGHGSICVPQNADARESAALTALLPAAREATWTSSGHLLSVDLRGAILNYEQLTELSTLTELYELKLDATTFPADGLANLAGLPKLSALSLCWTNVADSDVAAIAKSSSLELLDLRNTKISDTSLEYLLGSNRLRFVFISGNGLSKVAIGRFKEKRPECHLQ